MNKKTCGYQVGKIPKMYEPESKLMSFVKSVLYFGSIYLPVRDALKGAKRGLKLGRDDYQADDLYRKEQIQRDLFSRASRGE